MSGKYVCPRMDRDLIRPLYFLSVSIETPSLKYQAICVDHGTSLTVAHHQRVGIPVYLITLQFLNAFIVCLAFSGRRKFIFNRHEEVRKKLNVWEDNVSTISFSGPFVSSTSKNYSGMRVAADNFSYFMAI